VVGGGLSPDTDDRAEPGSGVVMRFGILGPFEVVDRHGRELALGGRKQRAVLAILVLHANEVVSSDRLIDELWGECAPATATKTVQVYVSHLRKALVDGLLVTRGGGYVLRTERCEVDVDRFRRLVADGRRALRAGDPQDALARLDEALGLWRGPPLAEFAYEPFAQSGIAQLEETRLVALEDRIDAELALGEHAAVVGELEALVREHPLRERVRSKLMLALYRSGRQADALEAYRMTRRVLSGELGLEPGRELQRMHRAILDHDPKLDFAAPATSPPRDGDEPVADHSPGIVERRVPTAGSRQRSRPAALIGAAVVLGLIVVAATVVLVRQARHGTGLVATADSVAVIDPGANRVVAQAGVGAGPGAIAAGPGGVWVANTEDHSISNIDPRTRKAVRTLAFGDSVDGVAADAGAVWSMDSTRGLAHRINPMFGTVLKTVKLAPVSVLGSFPSSPTALAANSGVAWFGNNAAQVVRVAGSRAGLWRIDVGNHPSGMAVGAGATWVTDDIDDTVSRIDPTGGVSATIPVGRGASGIIVGGGAVWVAETQDDALARIDPASNSITTTIHVGTRPHGIAWGDGSVWVTNSGDGTVSRVNPQTGHVTATIRVGQSPQAVVVTRGAVWVSIQAHPSSVASSSGAPPGVVRIPRERAFQTLDPPLTNVVDVDESQLLYATCAGLLTYPDRPGMQGKQLAPDAAQALPSVSADGRTYTFKIQPGFRFSPPSGAPVTAATFKHTIERVLNPHVQGYASGYMGDIVGMPAYVAGTTRHLAGVIADNDTLRIRLTAPAPDLPARIASLSFCVVPDDTPNTPQSRPIPTAGPYYIASSSPDQLILARNPNYGGHRPRIPREIVYSFGVRFARAVKDVAAGNSDYVSALQLPLDTHVPATLFKSLEQRYGTTSEAGRAGHQQYYVNPTLSLDSLALNTTRPLFASKRVRQAVNYAIDRQALVQHAGPFLGGQPISHYLPPGLPGSQPAAIYPLGSPNLAKARELATGVHAHAVMYTCNIPACIHAAQIIQRDLRAIGITVEVSSMSINAMYSHLSEPGAQWDIGWQNWQGDYADPSSFLSGLFDSAFGANLGRFSDQGWIRAIRQARRLSGERRLRAYGQLDHALATHAAPIVAWGTDAARDFFAPRVGCQIYQPIYGIDLGSLCPRN
jgi:YVTN family beta-propeller protein